MADHNYMPQTKVDWISQFKLLRKEGERIIGGPLASRSDGVKLNHVYTWASAESLIDARINKDPELTITPAAVLDQLAACLTLYFLSRKTSRILQRTGKDGKNTTTYFSRIMDLYRQAEFSISHGG